MTACMPTDLRTSSRIEGWRFLSFPYVLVSSLVENPR